MKRTSGMSCTRTRSRSLQSHSPTHGRDPLPWSQVRNGAAMYFEGRELKPYGEFVKASDLVVGRVYFRVSYLDLDMMIPELVPLVFIGRNLVPSTQVCTIKMLSRSSRGSDGARRTTKRSEPKTTMRATTLRAGSRR